MNDNKRNENSAANSIPDWMRSKSDQPPVHFLDLRGHNTDWKNDDAVTRVVGVLREIQEQAAPARLPEPAIIKVHIGEPLIVTSIIPSLAASTGEFLSARGVRKMAYGDTTVLYSSRRGGRENPHKSEKAYLALARERGWVGLNAPFVILDRPATSAPGVFEFVNGAVELDAGPPGRFPKVFGAGSLEVAKSFIQHAHMTGHLLTGLACCVKGMAMGLANRRGKAQMHLSLRPRIAKELCSQCGECAERCPENALDFSEGEAPTLIADRCLGCGQCMAECEQKAIEMKAIEKYDGYDWERGFDTIHSRMVDYVVGLMQGLWDSMLHVAHLVRMTPSCDCYNTRQTPMCDDIGFLVGRNPFTVDRIATDLLVEQGHFTDDEMRKNIRNIRGGDPFAYALKTYGIVSEANPTTTKYS